MRIGVLTVRLRQPNCIRELWYGSGQAASLRSIIDAVVRDDPPSFDFNADASVDVLDIDLLMDDIKLGHDGAAFDVNGDGVVRESDLLELVTAPGGLNTYIGDANLDGEFNSNDFVRVFQAGKYEQTGDAGWAEGDWNVSGFFDSEDFVAAFTYSGYEQGPRSGVAAVPEPASLLLLIIGLTVVAACRGR